jgi:hypothetical protein
MTTARSQAPLALHVVLFVFGTVSVGCTQKPPSGGVPCTGIKMSLAIAGPGALVPDCSNSGPLTFDGTATITFPNLNPQLTATTVVNGTSQTLKLVPSASAAPGTVPVSVHAVLGPGSTADYEVDVLLATANLGFTAAFQPATLAPGGGTSTLAISISNPSLLQFTGIGFGGFMGGLQVDPSSLSNNGCGGTFSATGNSISLAGASLPPKTDCSLAVNVSSTTGGGFGVTTAGVTSNEQYPAPGASAQLSIQTNPGPCLVLTSPTLPAGTESASYGFGFLWSAGCGSATGFSITQGALPAGLQINSNGTIDGTPTTVGTFHFTVHLTGTLGSASLDCSLAINPAKPLFTAQFAPASVAVGVSSTLEFSITDQSHSIGLTGMGFFAVVPLGLSPAATPPVVNGCGGTFTVLGATLTLSGGSLLPQETCEISVPVATSFPGDYSTTIQPLSTNETGISAGPAVTLHVATVPSPAFVSAFEPNVIDATGTATLSFDLVNPDAGQQQTDVVFTDTLPAGTQVAPSPNLTNTCGGSFSLSPTGFFLDQVTLPAGGECTLSIDLAATDGGVFTNTATIASDQSGPDGFSAASTLTVLPVPTGILTSIAVFPPTASIVAGHTIPFRAVGTFGDGQQKALTSLQWSLVQPTSIASITTQGVAQGLTASTQSVTVQATDAATGVFGTATLQVTAHGLVSITISPENPQLQAGSTLPLKATGLLDDGTTVDLTATATWTSSITSIATVGNGTHGGQVAGISVDSTPGVVAVTDPATGASASTSVLVTRIPVSITIVPKETGGTTNVSCVPLGTTRGVFAWTGSRDDGTGGVTFDHPTLPSATATLTPRPDGNGSNFYIFCSVTDPNTGFRGANFGVATLSAGTGPALVTISPQRLRADGGDVTFDATASTDLTVNGWVIQYGGAVFPNSVQDFLDIPQANWSTVSTAGAVPLLTVPAADFTQPGAYRALLTATSNNDFFTWVGTQSYVVWQ